MPGHRSRPLLGPLDAGLLAAYGALATMLGYALGQDLNWDLLNYHFYNPYQLLGGRLDRDIHVAGVQTFHNPLLDLPFYAAVRAGVPPVVFFVSLSAFHGVALWAVHRITVMLVPAAYSSLAHAAGMLAALTAAAGAGFHSGIGSTMGDNTVAVPLLVALLLLLRAVEDDAVPEAGTPRGGAIIAAGVLAGAAVGAKFTAGPVGVGLAAVALGLPGPLGARIGRLGRFGAGGVLGLALAGGFWSGRLFDPRSGLTRWRKRHIVSGQVGEIGLVVLGLWLLTLLTPESLLFATGDLRRLFDLPTPLQFNPTRFVKVEAAIAASQMLAVGLTARSMMRTWSPWPIVLMLLLGLGAKTLASASFFAPGDPLHWATPGGQIGLAAGAALLGVCLLLPARSHAMLAGMALLVGTALVNLAPENPFLPSDITLIRQGNFLNFHGLTQLTASLWPFITFAYLGLLGASTPRDSYRVH